MTAKEMFEKLGYKRDEYINASSCYMNKHFISYSKGKIHILFSSFSVPNSISKFRNGLFGIKNEDITINELKAINKQIEELGWNE